MIINRIKKVENDCPLCTSNDFENYTYGFEHEYDNTTNDKFNFVKCKVCNLVYLNPRPDESELSKIYPKNYYSYTYNQIDNIHSKSLGYILKRNVWIKRIKKGLKYVDLKNKIKFLDIGCGDGRVLNFLKSYYKDKIETFGVEVSKEAVVIAEKNSHKIYKGSFNDIKIPEKYFDVILASHVIEHISEPNKFLKKLNKIIKNNGVIIIETPNINSVTARLFKNRNWGGYHIPRHWQLYDNINFEKAAENNNFKVIDIFYHSSPHFWIWTFHSILKNDFKLSKISDILFPPVNIFKNGIYNYFLLILFTLLDSLINIIFKKTHNMMVILKKRDKNER